MTTKPQPTRVRQEPVAQTVSRLHTFVRRMERRYELSSAFVAEAVGNGTMKPTKEIGTWLMSYRMLKNLEGSDADHETGIRTTITA